MIKLRIKKMVSRQKYCRKNEKFEANTLKFRSGMFDLLVTIREVTIVVSSATRKTLTREHMTEGINVISEGVLSENHQTNTELTTMRDREFAGEEAKYVIHGISDVISNSPATS